MLGDKETRGYLNIYSEKSAPQEIIARACNLAFLTADLSLLLRLLTPCSILNNDFSRKCFGNINPNLFKQFFFLKYLEVSKFTECKLLVFEILTIYKNDHPELDEQKLFPSKEEHNKYLRWLMMNYPQVYSRLQTSVQQPQQPETSSNIKSLA